jgi:hypothetical protein
MKSLTAEELQVVSDVVDQLDQIALKYNSNITGTLYAAGMSFIVDYDEQTVRHNVKVKSE